MRRQVLAAMVVAAAALCLPAQALGQITSVFFNDTVSGVAIPCSAQSDGVRVCHGTDNGGAPPDLRFWSWDRTTPQEVYVILPPAPASGTDGSSPLVVQSHAWGGSAGGPDDTQYY